MILILILMLLSYTAFSQDNSSKNLSLVKSDVAIAVDGFIDDAWHSADSADGFVQFQPYNGKESLRRTVAKIITTENSLYCLIVCYDDRDNIEVNTGKLDDFTGDVVSLMLDTFNDKKTAYKFAVNSSGVRMDARMLDDGRNRDYTWDGIWFAESQVYNWGYVVEMEVPYKSIQYDETLSSWGLDFDRWIPALNEDSYWCAYELNEGQRISKFGSLTFNNFTPSVKGLNLEVYPVGISKATYLYDNKYKIEPNAGLDIFYNPSPKLTLMFTLNPDFAQIEADPFSFNISRYETYFNERRPFFTAGSEIFMPSGRERSSGFYRPLELFYSRRIGKKLIDGSEVPLITGTKVFGRLDDWEYGGFLALTGKKNYSYLSHNLSEPQAFFGSVSLKKTIYGNSTLGLLYVGKHTSDGYSGVLDIDGAFRGSNWQLAYQFARSFRNSEGDFASSIGFKHGTENWFTAIKGRYIGENFDVNEVGFVPWLGTGEVVALTGPVWYFDEGYIQDCGLFFGGELNYNKEDQFTDHLGVLGLNMFFRDNWRYEIVFVSGKFKELDKKFNSYEISLGTSINTSPTWSLDTWTGYSKTYNFLRDYLAFYSWAGFSFSFKAAEILRLGTSFDAWIEGNPYNKI
ncbi:MAG: hydrolase, partial [Ignavibacteria bacterium GWA2_36_19]